jgi:hypothetical protein
MFNTGDPRPEPFPWGQPTWATQQAYDKALAKLLGDLACSRGAPEAQTRSLASRAVYSLEAQTPGLLWGAVYINEPERLWPKLFAARAAGPDCPPAKGLPEDTRKELEELAAQSGLSKAPEETPGK